MFRIAKLGFLPSLFLDLKYDMTLCVSCVFVTARRMQWITKGKKLESIRKEADNNPVSAVSLDQIQSYQPCLVPQFSVKLTSARIWSAKVMVDHLSDLTYVHLIISTS